MRLEWWGELLQILQGGVGAGSTAGKNAVENNALGKKDKLPIYDMRPGFLKLGAIDENGELSKAGGGGVREASKGNVKPKPDYTLNKNGDMLGINGPTVPSKTLWMGKGKERIDVENPAPGKRAGQIHYQDNNNNKYYYDPVTQAFPGVPKSINNKLNEPAFKNAIDKGMEKYLGEK